MSEPRRYAVLPRLGVAPPLREVVGAVLDAAFERAEADPPARAEEDLASGSGPAVSVLDAGCGRVSALVPYRRRIGRFIGADIHPPAPGALPHLDAFVEADLCGRPDAFPPATFDVVLSSFTVEHFADPAAAFAAIRGWLRPGGTLVLVTVNRRHPFVAAYLDLPARPRARLQRLVKATAADAHPLVGACNDPRALRTALEASGYEAIELTSVGHLARAWGRALPGFALGLAGDLVAQRFPSRRSTLVISARAPGGRAGARPDSGAEVGHR
jgi:SAM-dependent methyltransferase